MWWSLRPRWSSVTLATLVALVALVARCKWELMSLMSHSLESLVSSHLCPLMTPRAKTNTWTHGFILMAVYTSSDGGTCSSKLKSGKLGRLSQAVARYTEICGPVAHCWTAHQISRHRKHAQSPCWLVGGFTALPENVLVNWVIRCDNHPEVDRK